MKHLNEYINEQLIDETLKEKAKKFWKWLWGDDEEHDRLSNVYADDVEGCALTRNKDGESGKKYNINTKYLTFESIKALSVLSKFITSSKPDKDSDKGFWLFDEALRKDNAYSNIGNKPWYIEYDALIDNIKDKSQAKNKYGLVSYSTKYNGENETLHVFDVQIDSEYKGNKLFDVILNHLKEVAYKNNKKYISLRTYEKSLVKFYEKYGFKKSKKTENLMIYTLNN